MRMLFHAITPLAAFGPLLATGMGGVLLDEPSWAMRRLVPLIGALLTTTAVLLLVGALRRQSEEILQLRADVRRLSGRNQ